MAIAEDFASRLRALRATTGLTQSEFEKAAGIGAGSCGWWETGRNMPSLATACKIADFYGITLEQLVGREPITL